MAHRYDRECKCEDCTNYERTLLAQVDVDRWVEGMSRKARTLKVGRPMVALASHGVELVVVATAKLAG